MALFWYGKSLRGGPLIDSRMQAARCSPCILLSVLVSHWFIAVHYKASGGPYCVLPNEGCQTSKRPLISWHDSKQRNPEIANGQQKMYLFHSAVQGWMTELLNGMPHGHPVQEPPSCSYLYFECMCPIHLWGLHSTMVCVVDCCEVRDLNLHTCLLQDLQVLDSGLDASTLEVFYTRV